jgi:hypothetical protein
MERKKRILCAVRILLFPFAIRTHYDLGCFSTADRKAGILYRISCSLFLNCVLKHPSRTGAFSYSDTVFCSSCYPSGWITAGKYFYLSAALTIRWRCPPSQC